MNIKKRCLLSIDVDPVFRRKVKEIAFDRNMPVSELVRRWIEKCIREETNTCV